MLLVTHVLLGFYGVGQARAPHAVRQTCTRLAFQFLCVICFVLCVCIRGWHWHFRTACVFALAVLVVRSIAGLGLV